MALPRIDAISGLAAPAREVLGDRAYQSGYDIGADEAGDDGLAADR